MRGWSARLVILLIVAGCASGGERASRNLLTADEIAGVDASDLYEVLEQLRPTFLDPYRQAMPSQMAIWAPRGHNEVVVYLDGDEAGPPEVLRNLSPSRVEEVRYLTSQAATSRFGTPHPRGAMLVTLRES